MRAVIRDDQPLVFHSYMAKIAELDAEQVTNFRVVLSRGTHKLNKSGFAARCRVIWLRSPSIIRFPALKRDESLLLKLPQQRVQGSPTQPPEGSYGCVDDGFEHIPMHGAVH